MKRIIVISDTHNQHEDLDIPECDILIHCGDATIYGNRVETRFFLSWFSKQRAGIRIYVPGNHDVAIEDNSVSIPSNVECLLDRKIMFDGIRMFGSPWKHRPERVKENKKIGFDAFSVLYDDIVAKRKLIPNTDILITHIPPMYCLDRIGNETRLGMSSYGGCYALLDRINEIDVKLHCFGHIHSGYGNFKMTGLTMINAALCNGEDQLTKEPVILDFDEKTGQVTFAERSDR